MQGNLYWISSLVFALVLILIIFNEVRSSKEAADIVEKSYRQMMGWVIFFCIEDAFWGLCAAHVIQSDSIFYLASMLFHLATVLTTFFWLRFILDYLGDKVKHPFVFLLIDVFVIAVECGLVIGNLFKPILFAIEDGVYVTKLLRPLAFFNQYVVYFTIGIITLLCSIEQRKSEKKRFLSVFAFTLAPILLGVFQFLYPEGPFYSMGYFLGCFVIHLFVVAEDREVLKRNKVFASLADIYYTMHIVDVEKNTAEQLVTSDIVQSLTGNIAGAAEMLNAAMKGTVCEEFVDEVLEFVDLSTLSERMSDLKPISCEFIGKNHGWTRVSFICFEAAEGRIKKVIVATQIIDAEKRSRMELVFKSSHDELSGLHNRRAYEEELNRLAVDGIPDNLVYLSMDLNGLKNVNDTLGHAAGDEIIIGAADCIKKVFGAYGKVYRTGGDEYAAIICAEKALLKNLLELLEDTVNNWSGDLVQSLSLSVGYAAAADAPSAGIHELAAVADKKMYEEKNRYYRVNGIDRRGQLAAHSLICAQYTKILRVNLTEDTYRIIDIKAGEPENSGAYGTGISGWLKEFAKDGYIHPGDLEAYYEKTEIGYLRDYFSKGNNHMIILYRRKIDGDFKHVMMEFLPTAVYTSDNQELYLYIKCLEV